MTGLIEHRGGLIDLDAKAGQMETFAFRIAREECLNDQALDLLSEQQRCSRFMLIELKPTFPLRPESFT